MTASTTLTAPIPAAAQHPATTVALVAADPPAPRVRLRRMSYEPDPGAPPRMGTGPAPLDQEPPAPDLTEADRERTRRALGGSLRLAMEVLDGRRPATQLGHHFEDSPLRYWRAAAHRRQVRTPARVVRMRLCLPRTGAAEVAAVCDIDGRVRALAARYEQRRPGASWRCTAVRLG